MTNGYYTLYGDHFEMYRNTELLYCAPGTNIVVQVNYTSKTNSEKETRFVINRGQGRGRGTRGRQSKGTNFNL